MNTTEGAFTCKQYLKNGKYSDVVINVSGGIQKRQFKCHKIILATKSEVLESLVDNKNDVNIKDTDPDMFYNLLYYIYTDKIKTVLFDSLPDLFRSAQEFGVHCFEINYKREIKIDFKYILYYIEYCRRTRDTVKEKELEAIIERRTKLVLEKTILEGVSTNNVLWLLNHKDLNLDSDYELMVFLAKYRDRTKPSAEFMQNAKKKIRYLNMNKQKLNELNKVVKILDEREMFVVNLNLDKSVNKWSTMEGFTRDRKKRSDYRREPRE